MGETAMELSSEQKDFIGSYIRENLKVWITESATNQTITEHEIEIRERIVRVEESLNNQISLMKQGFENMDKRFELLTGQLDKRFELLTNQMNSRFEQVDKRFNQMFAYFTTGIVILGILITVFQMMG